MVEVDCTSPSLMVQTRFLGIYFITIFEEPQSICDCSTIQVLRSTVDTSTIFKTNMHFRLAAL